MIFLRQKKTFHQPKCLKANIGSQNSKFRTKTGEIKENRTMIINIVFLLKKKTKVRV